MGPNDQQPGGQYPDQQYPDQQQYAQPQYGQQQYPGYQHPPVTAAPVRETGKRVASMVFLVIGYVLGGLFLLASLTALPELLSEADASAEGIGYALGTFVGLGLVTGPFVVLVVLMHVWRRRIKRRESAQVKHVPWA